MLLLLLGMTVGAEEGGEILYQEGRLATGELLVGRTVGDVELRATAAACATCHRRSGFGTGEGGAYVPPITAPHLFSPRSADAVGHLDRAERFRDLYQETNSPALHARMRDPRVRPAYDRSTLAKALSTGKDPAGRILDPLMPRYALSEADFGALERYLRTLGVAPDPGVEEARIHFATVITPGVDPGERAAMEDLLRAYVKRKNTDTTGQLARPGHSPGYRDDFHSTYREWVLHLWQLEGSPQQWGKQLESFYREQPVFALISGLDSESWSQGWRRVHNFCESFRVPCLFPHTHQPPAEAGRYALYFSPGLAVEGKVLGTLLPEDAEVVQVARAGGLGEVAAEALAAAYPGEGPATTALENQASAPPSEGGGHLVLWLRAEEIEALAGQSGWHLAFERAEAIYLSTALVPELPPSLAPWSDKIRLTHRHALPGEAGPRIHRVRAWIRSRGIERRHERIQLNTFFALTLADHALTHLVGNFSREYFLESIEHEVENALNPGTFPHLSLGPGQRFASRGCGLVRLAEDGEFKRVGEWVVPW